MDFPKISPIKYNECAINESGPFTETVAEIDFKVNEVQEESLPLLLTDSLDVSKEFHEPQLNEIPLYDSSKSIDEKDLQSSEQKTRKAKTDREWEFFCEYENSEKAKSSVDSNMWGRCRKTHTEDGVKQYFRCNRVKLRGPQCAAAMFHLFVSDKDVVIEFHTKSHHTHDDLTEDKHMKEKKKRLEAEVEKLVKLNVKRKRIMQELSQMDDIIMPTIQQLTTLIVKIRKKIFGPVTISMTELSNWLENHTNVPDDIHDPFVLSYEVDSECDEPFFRFIITTKYLLGLIKLRNFTHCDTTYKCIWQGFPVFMVSTTDYEKAYQPYGLCVCTFEATDDFKFLFESLKIRTKEILGFEMVQKTLVCDAAFAIINAFRHVFGDDVVVVMCWYHAKTAIEDQLKFVEKENRDEILSDIEFLHIASTPKIFDDASEVFLHKWSGIEKNFCEYFEDQWLIKHRNWYLGAADYTPCHNNALESSNRYLKDSNTIRLRHPLPHFLIVAMNTVGGWSNDFTIGLRKFAHQPKVDLALWTKSYNWARANIETKVIGQSEGSLTVEVKAEISTSKKLVSGGIVISDDIVQVQVSKEADTDGDLSAEANRPKINARKSKKETLKQLPVAKYRKFESLSQPAIRSDLSSQVMPSKVTTSTARKEAAAQLSSTDKLRESLTKIANVKDLSSQEKKSKMTIRKSEEEILEQLSVEKSKVCESSSQPARRSDMSSQVMPSKVTTRSAKKVAAGRLSNTKEKNESLSQIANGSLPQPANGSDFKYYSKKFDEYKTTFCTWTATVAKNENVLYESRCNCPAFAKDYICKHIVGLAIRLKLVNAPPEAKTVPIGQKRKRGRPAKTKPALMIQ